MEKKRNFKPLIFISAVFFGLAILALLSLLFLYLWVRGNVDYSLDEELFIRATSFETTTFYANSSSDNTRYVPMEVETSGVIKKKFTPLESITPTLINGFVAVEDRGFFEHSGVDIKRTALAAVNYLFDRDKPFGASTITQQLIKNLSGDNDVSIKRKLSEILRSLHLEKRFDKEDIIELYLNVIPMSEEIYGVGEAANKYFGKRASELSISECATLIGITNAPTAYSPYLNPEKCIEKRNQVLSVMLSESVITEEEYESCVLEPLVIIPKDKMEDRFDSWFVEAVIDSVSFDLSEKYGITESAARRLLLGGGYKVYTTMNKDFQDILEDSFEDEEQFERAMALGVNYSMVILDSENADTLAIVGNAGKKEANRLMNHALVPHTPASALKPFSVYAPLLDKKEINWATVIDDVPVNFIKDGEDLRSYPRNSPDVYSGLTTVKDALRLSKNTVAVKLLDKLGHENSFDFLNKTLGIDTLVRKENINGKSHTDLADAPLALGQLTKGITLQKLTECYTVFPSGGKLGSSRNYIKVTDDRGNTVLTKEKNSERVISEETAAIMNMLLSTVTDGGTAKGLKLSELVDTAGKTGTASGGKERCFIGYTPYYTAGIYMGKSGEGSVAGLSPTHLSLWDKVMTEIHNISVLSEEPKSFSTKGLFYLPYCMDSGDLYSDNCILDPRGCREEYGFFTKDNMPTEKCHRHILVDYDTVKKGVVIDGRKGEDICKVSLIKVTDRAFPKDVTVTDAQFVYRYPPTSVIEVLDPMLAYFEYSLPEGIYAGHSEAERQFNTAAN